MSIYRFNVTIEGTIDVEADSLDEAKEIVADGYSKSDVDIDSCEEEYSHEVKVSLNTINR